MKMSRGVIISCLLAVVVLSCESAYQRLKSINDLKKIDFGKSVPKHSLLLLHWFANIIYIDNNNVLHLSFNPNTEEFGSHHYGNFEDMLDPLPRGYRYYTVGNLHEDRSDELPRYVLNPVREYNDGNNMDRIIFRVQEQNSGVNRIDRVFITQHYRQHEDQGTRYNPEHTYQISTSLLQQIQQFSVEGNQRSLRALRDQFQSNADDSHLKDLRNTWGNLACLGLLLFIVIQERYSKNRPLNNRHQSAARRNTQADYVVNIPDDVMINMPNECNNGLFYNFSNQLEQQDQMQLEVVTGKNGNAQILWRNVARQRLKEGVAVVLFKHQTDQKPSTYKLIQSQEGSYDTSVPLNEGLQVRLHKARTQCFFWTKLEGEICRGRGFQSFSDSVLIKGYNAKLQLFVRDGKACARLYVKKSFRQWRSEFKMSWVGFYSSAEEDINDYEWWQWQWATKFEQCPNKGNYYIFEYYSGMTVAPGVQARFILKDNMVKACTPTWC